MTRIMSSHLIPAATGAVLLFSGMAKAAIIVNSAAVGTGFGDGGNLVSGTVTGTLVAIDVPTLDTSVTYTPASPGGPSWTTGGGIIAHAADQGFYIQTRAGDVYGTRSPWEPDGTPLNEAENYGAYNGTDPEVTYYFNFANSGIDLPDGSQVHAVYMTWNTRGVDNANWTYSETTGDTQNIQYASAPDSDLVLRWYDSDSNPHDANFQNVFNNPSAIIVNGGDGFILTGVRQPNTMHIDAVILDVTIVPEPSTALLSIGGLLLCFRRRRQYRSASAA